MLQIEGFFLLSFAIQLCHSLEELSTGFHRKWYLFKMPFWLFLSFEICFTLFWFLVLIFRSFPHREELQIFFLILMFANGIQHILWWMMSKKYVPGLITAFLHAGLFLTFYFSVAA